MPMFAPSGRQPRAAAVLALCLLSTPAFSADPTPDLPAGVEAMIRQAAADGDAATLDKTISLALAAFPAHTDAITTLGDGLRQKREAQALDAKRTNGRHLLSGWAGSGELGASLSSGNSDDKAFAFGLALSKETIDWRHRVSAAADYQRSDGETSKQRYSAGYEPNYFINDALYAAGQFGWERDLFAGYRHRFTETAGLGYVLIDNGVTKLEVEGGPGARHTLYAATDTEPRYTENEFVFRAAADFTYQFSDDASFSQTAKTLIGAENRTLEATSALTTRINALFSAKVSFTVRNESDPADDRKATDTLTRATLVYSF